MKILLSRTKASNYRSAKRLEDLGFETVSLALSEVVDTGAEIAASPVHGYILTSSNAARILGLRNSNIKGPFYVVGERTKAALLDCGLSDVRYVARNAKHLGDFIATEYQVRKFTYIAGEQRAFDFDKYFENYELTVDIVELYRIERIDPGLEKMKEALSKAEGGIHLHYSSLSAVNFFELIQKYSLESYSKSMRALGISKKTSLAVDNLLVKSVHNAKIESEDEMIKTLESFRR
ncbi:MAG: uroporphyrinogen-III synthase [Nitratireductor sp.]